MRRSDAEYAFAVYTADYIAKCKLDTESRHGYLYFTYFTGHFVFPPWGNFGGKSAMFGKSRKDLEGLRVGRNLIINVISAWDKWGR